LAHHRLTQASGETQPTPNAGPHGSLAETSSGVNIGELDGSLKLAAGYTVVLEPMADEPPDNLAKKVADRIAGGFMGARRST
jgi:hypothetical protein